MTSSSAIPLYLISVGLFLVLFIIGVFVGARFMFGFAMDALGYPTGLALFFPKMVGIIGALAGGFWGIFLAVVLTRMVGRNWADGMEFGSTSLLSTTISAFVTFVAVFALSIVFLNDRLPFTKIFDILLQT